MGLANTLSHHCVQPFDKCLAFTHLKLASYKVINMYVDIAGS